MLVGFDSLNDELDEESYPIRRRSFFIDVSTPMKITDWKNKIVQMNIVAKMPCKNAIDVIKTYVSVTMASNIFNAK